MVFDVNSHSFHVRVERWPLGNRPAQEHSCCLEPQVIMQSAGAVVLHHKPPTVRFKIDHEVRPSRMVPTLGAEERPGPVGWVGPLTTD